MMDVPQPRPIESWKNVRTASKTSIRGWKMLARNMSGGIGRERGARSAEEGVRRDGVVAAATEGIAPQQSPRGEGDSAQDAIGLDRVHRVLRATGVVAAPSWKRGRDHALIEPDRRDRDAADRGHGSASRCSPPR